MMIQGRVTADGLTVSTRAMITQMSILNVHTDNIAHYGLPGYQRKEPVVTSFVEHLGPQAVDKVTNTEIGRLRLTGSPLDVALNTKGYFQKLNPQGGVELTRDGRFRLDKDGYLLATDGQRVLSANGSPLRLSTIPRDLSKGLKVNANGEVLVLDEQKGERRSMGRLGVVSQDGSAAATVDVKQGYIEDSNVYLQKEFVALMPLRRQFEANRQLFILQSDSLSRMIQELGRAQ